MRKRILSIAVAATTVLGAASTANAAAFCGPGWRPTVTGRCVPVRRAFFGPRRFVVGAWVPGRGWWDGRRFWPHRYRWGGGWRYR